MKKIKILIVGFIGFLFSLSFVSASDDGVFSIKDEASFDECLRIASNCKLTSDIKVSSEKVIKKEFVLDLDGHTITPQSTFQLHSGFLYVDRGGKLTINDSKGTGKISSGTSGNVWAAIQLIKEGETGELSELIVNGGTIEGYYYGIVGNGKKHNTKVTINDGTIKCTNTDDCTAIFQPQEGDLIINNGTISGGSGIEIRAGKLTVYDGVIKGLDENFSKMSNRNGTTTEGVGIAVAQHITKKPIHVSIFGGTISGQYAFYEWNSETNSEEDINKIKIKISGGDFTGLASGVKAVYSEDFTNFISGGKFNTNVDEYLTSDANVVSKIIDTTNKGKESKKGIWLYFLPILVILSGVVVFFKKEKLFFTLPFMK